MYQDFRYTLTHAQTVYQSLFSISIFGRPGDEAIIIRILPLFAYFLVLLPSAITIIVFYTCYCDIYIGHFQITGSRYHDPGLVYL